MRNIDNIVTMSMTEFLDRLNSSLALLEVAEDQMVEAHTQLQLCELYPEAHEVRILRKALNRTLADLRAKVRENVELEKNL